DRILADSLYEEMVDRDSNPPPRPRDPLVLELTGKDTYRLRIYPVKLGNHRRFRLRYHLPPRIGTDGLEMGLRGVVGVLFPSDQTRIQVDFLPGGTTRKAILVEGNGRVTLELPRTRFVRVADLAPQLYFWSPWQVYQSNMIIRILPIDPTHQVMLKTRFDSGSFAGHYLNLHAGVDAALMKALGPKVEIVVYWKWSNPGAWIHKDDFGGENTTYAWQAQQQAANLLSLHETLGGSGMKIGLLHDDSRQVRAFRAAGSGDTAYRESGDYLRELQGEAIMNFARASSPAPDHKPGDFKRSIAESKIRFLSNLRLVRTLYSPETGVIRHLLMVSAGPEPISTDSALNDSLVRILDDVTLSGHGGDFAQAGLDFPRAKAKHRYDGPSVPTAWGDLPGLPAATLTVVVRNQKKAYDFTLACPGGLGLSCEALEFHGKSDSPWNDSLEWEAFDAKGKTLARVVTHPRTIGEDRDTAVAVLWAGSASPFSEKREQPLGPVYGFVDRWASMLALERDVMDRERAAAYADSGVARIANMDLKDVLPNYEEGQGPGNPTGIRTDGALFADPTAWKVERAGRGSVALRIPGLRQGMQVKVEAFDLHGRAMGAWELQASEGQVSWQSPVLDRGGVFLLKVRLGAYTATKRIAL
ncbi:MAG TPA: hypothetical protein VK465_13570, partial [Fibrobacteria bacterium]|nr:hypothetical protein [Fibrobacteria bacterium]